MKKTVSKILIIAPAWVGDMVMAQVLFRLLKTNNPEAIIDIVAPPSTAGLANRMPEVNEVFTLKVGHGGLQLKERFTMGRSLRNKGYDQAILMTNSWKSALIPWFAGIPIRTGWLGEMRYGLVNDIRHLDKNEYPLMIQRFAMLGIGKHAELPNELLWPKLQVNHENIQRLQGHLQFDRSKPVVALCPGAEYGPAKRWLPEYFTEVANHYLAKDWQVWLVGGPKDQELANLIEANSIKPCVNLIGKTSLADAIDLMALPNLVVTNDSGLMHIAAAHERPMVVIYGSTSPQFTPPLSRYVKILSKKLPCSPCFERTCPLKHYHCLTELKPSEVIQAADQLL